MKVTPRTERELRDAEMNQPGVYGFEIVSCVECDSPQGEPQFELQLSCFTDDIQPFRVKGWVTYSTTPYIHRMLRRFFDCIGLIDRYNAGEVQAYECVGRAGKCRIGHRNGAKGGTFYQIKEFIVESVSDDEEIVAKPSKPAPVSAVCADDEVPF